MRVINLIDYRLCDTKDGYFVFEERFRGTTSLFPEAYLLVRRVKVVLEANAVAFLEAVESSDGSGWIYNYSPTFSTTGNFPSGVDAKTYIRERLVV